MNRKLKIGFLVVFCFLYTVASSAQSAAGDSSSLSPVDELINMSIEQLLNLQVTVASKNTEKVSDAPGMITVYSASDVEKLGYYTLKDLTNITSGYSSFSAFGETNLETRGQKAGSWNVSKHLLLIDGIPVNHARANSAPVEHQVPLYFADRVEFLKGPGSALYGTSAFYGVMSVTPKTFAGEGSTAEGKFSAGAFNSKRMMVNAFSSNAVGQTSINFGYYSRGFSGDSIGIPTNNKLYDNENSIFLNGSFKFKEPKLKGLGIGVIYMHKNSYGGEFWGAQVSPNNQLTWEELIPYAKYQREINEKVSVNSYLKWNSSIEKSNYGASWNNATPSVGYDFTTADVEGLSEFRYTINTSSSLIGGLNYYTRKELGSPTSFTYATSSPLDTAISKSFTYDYLAYSGSSRVHVASAYAQYQKEWDFLKGFLLTAGTRLDKGMSEVGTYTHLSPRVALVQRLTDNWNIKGLYGQALRVPGVKEIGLNAEAVEKIRENGGNGNTNDIRTVKAEIIKSVEGGLNYNSHQLSIAVAGFFNRTTAALDGAQYSYIDKNGNEQTSNYFKNLDGNIQARGVEIDIQFALNNAFKLMMNHAYAKAMINDSTPFVDVPTQKTNLAAHFTLGGKFKLSTTAVVRHVWGFRVANGTYDESLVEMNSPSILKGYSFVDLNILVPITANLGCELQVRNLLDTQWKQPSLLGQSSMIPLLSRNVLATVYVKF